MNKLIRSVADANLYLKPEGNVGASSTAAHVHLWHDAVQRRSAWHLE